MLKELQDLGLSEKEARVYLSALEIGRATADQLAKHAKIVRSTTYVQLESLMQMGLMSTYEEGKKTYFAPESPELLKRLLLKKKDELATKERDLASFLPDLIRQFEGAGERPVVRFFNGKEGITAMREDALLLGKGQEMNIIYSYDSLFDLYTEKEAGDYAQRRLERGIQVRSLYTRKAGKMSRENADSLTSRRFVQSDRLPLDSDFFVYDNKVAMMALKGTIFGVIVESKEIAHSFRSIFNLMWSTGEEE
ncbi:hypothetical protein HYT05_04280 [Candidatus Kaiserbacteria bacterium]|nr:hypothetical protein [Candidatus Kaiserbacteria bacterium]